MKKSIIIFSALLSVMIFFASFGGAYATWKYAQQPVSDAQTLQNVTLSEFVWEPEEILPVTPGQNYLDLHESILHNSKNGLNSSKDALEKAIIKEILLHSTDNIQGGNLKHLFISEECKELDFLIEYISQTEFHLFMYSKSDLQTGAVGKTEIQVYMSILIKENDKWYGEEAQFGYAMVQYLPNTSVLAIDVDTWTR